MPVAEDAAGDAVESDAPIDELGGQKSEVDENVGIEGESEEIAAEEKSASENIEDRENGGVDADAVGGGKEVDESAAENIAQPEVSEESKWAEEEVQGPEVTSDRLQGAGGEEEDVKGEEEKGIEIKDSEVMNALYERMSSSVASAHSNGKKDKEKEQDHKDPVVDSVLSVAAPYVEFAVSQAQVFKNGMAETTDSAVKAACNQLGGLQDSSTLQYYYAKDMFWRFKREYREYENAFFSTLKDGVKAAAANPGTAAVLATGAALVLLRRPRRLLLKYTLGRFRSQEAMTASAQKKVVELREALEQQKNEKRKLEERFRLAEEEFLRGQSKMGNAGGQIRSLVRSMYKTENHAQGLVEKLRDMPGKPAFHLRAEVASMASEAKAHRNTLDKNLYKIANYNIRV